MCVREPAASPPAGPAGPAGSATSRAVDFSMHIYVSMYALLVVVLTAVGRAAGVATAAAAASALSITEDPRRLLFWIRVCVAGGGNGRVGV